MSIQKWKESRVIITFAIITFLFTIILASLYFGKFHADLSSKHSVWAEFGSFFAGTIGTVLSAFNVLCFIFLTRKIANQDRHKWMTDLRISAYQNITAKLYLITSNEPLSTADVVNIVEWVLSYDFENLFFLDETQMPHLNSILSRIKNHQPDLKDQFQGARFNKPSAITTDIHELQIFLRKIMLWQL